MSIHIRLTSDQLAEWAAEFPEAVRRGLQNATPQVESLAKSLTPQDTGALAESIEVEQMGYGLRVRWSAPYAKYAEKGAEPHEIRPKTAAVLRFLGKDGKWVFAKKVAHPGYPGWHFKQNIRDLVMQVVKAMVQFEILKISRRA